MEDQNQKSYSAHPKEETLQEYEDVTSTQDDSGSIVEGEVIKTQQIQELSTTEAIEPEFASKDVRAKFQAILNDLHISKRPIVFIAGGIAAFVVLSIILIFALRFLFGAPPTEITTQQAKEAEITEHFPLPSVSEPADTKEDSAPFQTQVFDVQFSSDDLDPSLKSGILLSGERLLSDDRALFGLFQQVALIEGDLARRIEQLEIIRQIVREDIFVLVSTSSDPEQSYDKRFALLATLFEQGQEIGKTLQNDVLRLRDKFFQQVALKDGFERDFFQALSNFDGVRAEESLQAFNDASFEQGTIKADIRAREKLIDMYGKVLLFTQNLMNNLEKNKDAVVAGVRVFDIGGDPLNLVVKENEK